MKHRSIRDFVLLVPRPLRKFVRYRVLPKRVAEKVGSFVDEGRDSLFSTLKPSNRRPYRRDPGSAHWLEDRLWGGFSREASIRMEALKRNPFSSDAEISEAARRFGVWYASKGDFLNGYENAVFARVARPAKPGDARWIKQVVLEADCLFGLDKNDEVKRLIDAALLEVPNDISIILTKANTLAGFDGATYLEHEAERLSWINRVFDNENLVRIHRKDPTRPLTFDNLDAPTPDCSLPIEQQPLVSVLVPSFRAEDTLRMAIESILKQSWRNLEVIIVDDRSPDNTFELAQKLSQEDPRVNAFCLPTNGGAYVARNTALRHARGEFVTVHDADDWSHPQKIEEQVLHLIAHPSAVGNCSDWVRARPNLFFRGQARSGAGSRVILNHSSLLVRRQELLALGGWDEVRVAGDSEFLRRLVRAHDMDYIAQVRQDVPLSFALETVTSLTRRESSHIFTLWHGVRRTYHEASAYWLDTHAPGRQFALSSTPGERAFPAPRQFLTQQAELKYDVLFVADFALKGEALETTLNYVRAAISLDNQVALFHYPHFDLGIRDAPSPEFMELAQQGRVRFVSPGTEVEANTVIVAYPTMLTFVMDIPPKLNTERLYVIASQLGSPSTDDKLPADPDRITYDPRQVAENIVEMFGISPTWIPSSDLGRHLMVADGRYTPIHHESWPPLIETKTWCSQRVRYRGAARSKPTIGRHALDHYTNWPQSADTICEAYCSEKDVAVQLMGGATIPKRLIGRLPANWTVRDPETLDVRTFLLGLDFYIHYPHENYVEEFGRAVLEAMAVGLPVILPPVFEPTFKEAALYAEPHEVWPIIKRIWNNEAEWQARSDASLQFVQSQSDWAQLAHRLAGLNS